MVTIVTTAASASDAPAVAGIVSVRRNVATSQPLTVFLLAGGSAIAGSDYTPLPPAVTIPTKLSNVYITIVPIDDAILDTPDTVTLTVRLGAVYGLGAPASASVTIASRPWPRQIGDRPCPAGSRRTVSPTRQPLAA